MKPSNPAPTMADIVYSKHSWKIDAIINIENQ
jgi:hypothetical protein